MTSVRSGQRSGVAFAAAWAITLLTFALVGFIVWSDYRAGAFSANSTAILSGAAYVGTLLAFVISGAVIASRQPGNVVGWLLIVPGLSAALSEAVNIWLEGLNPVPMTADPAIWFGLWYVNWSWVLLIYPIFHLLLVFPDGKLLSSGWRWVVALELFMIAFMVGGTAFGERLALISEDDVATWSIANPIGFLPDSFFESAFGLIWSAGLLFLTVAGVVAFVQRFRHGSSLQRQQLKWPLYAVGVFGLSYGTLAVSGGPATGSVWEALFALSLAAIPISVAVAVLRFRLYELDRLVSRTVTYAVVAALLIGAYLLIVLGLGSFLGRDNPLAVAGATLGAAALFSPLRSRIRGWVDRRFNRSRYDAERVIDGFVATMRDGADPESLVEGWVGVVSETMQPTSVGAWVRA